MAVYAIGDVQGCFSCLKRLLDKINFDDSVDTLWFCGDLVNRGPESLASLRFVKALGERAIVVLGNHDLHLLAIYHRRQPVPETDTLHALLNSSDCDELMAWLQSRPLLHYDNQLQKLLVHAGIHPQWSLEQATNYATEVEQVLVGKNSVAFFENMYGDQPDRWSEDLNGFDRLRCITNILTRMRFFWPDERIDMEAKGSPQQHQNTGLTPWFELNNRHNEAFSIVFGHWSTLAVGTYGRHYAIDGGCVWGGEFFALKIDENESQWFSINC